MRNTAGSRFFVLVLCLLCLAFAMAEGIDDDSIFADMEWWEPEQEIKTSIMLQEGEIEDNWEEIIQAIDDGTVQQRYKVGAWKPLELKGIGTINMQLAGFELDELAGGTGKAATTWIAKELLPEPHRMNPPYDDSSPIATGAIGGWEQCEIRRYLNIGILDRIPINIRGGICQVKKEQVEIAIDMREYTQITLDYLWIPSDEEVFAENAIYSNIFGGIGSDRVKGFAGIDDSTSWWWLRSAFSKSNFGTVASYGLRNNGNASSEGGVLIGFCL